MIKKRVLFVIPEYSHGGTNKSLENLLHFIDFTKYEVSIYSLYEDGGFFYKDIFKPYIARKSFLYVLAHDNFYTRKVMGLFIKLIPSLSYEWLYKYEANRLQKSYDVVVAFQEGSATEFVSYMHDIKNKIAWVHCDYGEWWKKNKNNSELELYRYFHTIVTVSDSALNSFVSVYPELKNHAVCIYNTIDTEKIYELSEEITNPYPENHAFIIMSVGRFVKVKQFYLIPDIVLQLKRLTNRKFCWYIVGDGADRLNVHKRIKDLGLENEIVLLGAKDNPYPFFKHADLHVCTSESESFSYTVAEAKILHTPVLCNDFPVSAEVVTDHDGWICNVKDMALKLRDIIDNDNNIFTNVKKSILDFRYNNDIIIKKLDEILR